MDDNQKPHELEGALLIGDDEAIDYDDPESEELDYDTDHPNAEDGKAELASEILVSILQHMDIDAAVTTRENAERVVLDLQGPDAGRAIGKKGQTLDALQFVVNKIVNRFPDGRRHIVLDSGDYRARRDNGLISLARREAKRAIQQSRVITLEPMSPRDRRVIHLSLAKFPGVSTRSDGQGSERRVRIIPARGRGPRHSRR